MGREEVSCELRGLAFEFFFRFTRFEFALKENGYLRNPNPVARATPGWDHFIARWHKGYQGSDDARRLIDAAPKRQVVGPTISPEWRTVDLRDCKGQLGRVIRLRREKLRQVFRREGRHPDPGAGARTIVVARG